MMMMMMMMMTMMIINCFSGMVDRQEVFSLIFSQGHCQRSSPSGISNTPQGGHEPTQILSSGLVEFRRSCIVVITTIPQPHLLGKLPWQIWNKLFKENLWEKFQTGD